MPFELFKILLEDAITIGYTSPCNKQVKTHILPGQDACNSTEIMDVELTKSKRLRTCVFQSLAKVDTSTQCSIVAHSTSNSVEKSLAFQLNAFSSNLFTQLKVQLLF